MDLTGPFPLPELFPPSSSEVRPRERPPPPPQHQDQGVAEPGLQTWFEDRSDNMLNDSILDVDFGDLGEAKTGAYGRGFYADRDVNGMDLGVPCWQYVYPYSY
jgi:hypothetical protein